MSVATTYEILVKDVPAQRVLSLRVVLGVYCDQVPLWGRLFAFAQTHGLQIGGPEFIMYYDQEYKEQDIDAELCVPLADGGADTQGHSPSAALSELGATIYTLPGGRAASVTHVGPHGDLSPVYDALFDWIRANNERHEPPVKEIYLKIDGPKEAFVTELQQPLLSREHSQIPGPCEG